VRQRKDDITEKRKKIASFLERCNDKF